MLRARTLAAVPPGTVGRKETRAWADCVDKVQSQAGRREVADNGRTEAMHAAPRGTRSGFLRSDWPEFSRGARIHRRRGCPSSSSTSLRQGADGFMLACALLATKQRRAPLRSTVDDSRCSRYDCVQKLCGKTYRVSRKARRLFFKMEQLGLRKCPKPAAPLICTASHLSALVRARL